MSPLLEQFIQEARDFLQGIGEKLMALESEPDSPELMTELFRLVHTLKGNSGLFEFPDMTRVLHAGEDLMDAVRDGRVAYSEHLADSLLDAMDFVGMLVEQIENSGGELSSEHAQPAQALAKVLRALIPDSGPLAETVAVAPDMPETLLPGVLEIPEAVRLAAWQKAAAESLPLVFVHYTPESECFFKGEDPFHQVRQTPGTVWGRALPREAWQTGPAFDCYRCALDFELLAVIERAEVDEYFRYTPEQARIVEVLPTALMVPAGHPNGGPVYGDFVAEATALLEAGKLAELALAVDTLLALSAPELWLSSALRWLQAVLASAPTQTGWMRALITSLNTLTPPDFSTVPMPLALALPAMAGAPTLEAADRQRLGEILAVQRQILALPDSTRWRVGHLRSVATTLAACAEALGLDVGVLDAALEQAVASGHAAPLRDWLETVLAAPATLPEAPSPVLAGDAPDSPAGEGVASDAAGADAPVRFGRRVEDVQGSRVLKVDQEKVDRLMNLIGEMVVAKNALPYLANRAENQYQVRELSREIKAQYAVINRIAEEMQDAIMQVRMMPVSFIFQRFPRLVRDISRKLGKEVELVLEGEQTEADKNIVESLADPLIHIVRNSLDHGLEMPAVRESLGKPRAGRLLIRAGQESDRVWIEITDDGRGIDPAVIRRKALEKGVIDAEQYERLSDEEAVNLVFAPGFSTAETISDLSGRGVGMDVVHSAIERVGGTVALSSQVGLGTTLRLSLPLSMAVTNVMILESDGQIFGVPMDLVVETVRLPAADVRQIKRQKTVVLRGRIVPLVALNDLLAIDAAPRLNEDNEMAALVVRVGMEQVGLLVDEFREVVDVILKPLPGDLSRLRTYAGSALLGDGSVLMILNPKELF